MALSKPQLSGILLASICFAAMGLYILITFWKKNSSPFKKRRSDKKILSSAQQQSLKKAQQFIREKKLLPAAELLEGLGLYREAVKMLEDAGFIDEASQILVKIKRPNRAAAVFARHGYWVKAAKYYVIAEMPLEAARCYREGFDYVNAATYFLKAKKEAEAADCFLQLKDLPKAAHYFMKGGNDHKAADLYQKIFEQSEKDGSTTVLEPDELDFLTAQVSRGGAPRVFVKILAKNHRLSDAMFALLRYEKIDSAADIILQFPDEACDGIDSLISGNETAQKNYTLVKDRVHMSEDTAMRLQNSQLRSEQTSSELQDFKEADEPEVTTATDITYVDNNLLSVATKARIFQDLNSSEKTNLLNEANQIVLAPGERLFVNGEAPQGIYLVVEGLLFVEKAKDHLIPTGENRSDVRTGEAIGLSWVLLDELPEANYQAGESKVLVLFIEKARFNEYLDKNPTVARKLYKSLTRQIRLEAVTYLNHRKLREAS